MVDERRVRALNDKPDTYGPMLYVMSRDQRVEDNWALLYVAALARERQQPIIVLFNLYTTIAHMSQRHYDFMVGGLQEVERSLQMLQIPFVVTVGVVTENVVAVCKQYQVGEVVFDMNPLRGPMTRVQTLATMLSMRATQVDAHNIVPVWEASEKLEFAAHTLRPKVHRKLPEFLTEFPKLEKQKIVSVNAKKVDWEKIKKQLAVDASVSAVEWVESGGKAAHKTLTRFMRRLPGYAERRNDPNQDALSHLSPYLHYGHISAQRVALAVQQAADVPKADKDAFLEELIVRRELADNFCFYNKDYDKVAGAHAWAQKTIWAHAKDKRAYMYTKEQFEAGETHDELWNAMQLQMVKTGKMHGWCRMYWAKKIFEWSKSPQIAIDIALYLNNKYELDGRDPNGVVGVMWSICGVHDRAWTERPVFGKIRYMNFNGAKRKFDVGEYIDTFKK